MPNKPSKLYLKYKTIYESGFIKKSEIISLKKLFNSFDNGSFNQMYKNIACAETDTLFTLYIYENNICNLDLSKNQHEKATTWFRSKTYTDRGSIKGRPLLNRKQRLLLNNCSDFTFKGFVFDSLYLPVYRINTTDSRYLEYYLSVKKEFVVLSEELDIKAKHFFLEIV